MLLLGPKTQKPILSSRFGKILKLLIKQNSPELAFTKTQNLPQGGEEYGIILYEIGNIFKHNYRDTMKWLDCVNKIPPANEYYAIANFEAFKYFVSERNYARCQHYAAKLPREFSAKHHVDQYLISVETYPSHEVLPIPTLPDAEKEMQALCQQFNCLGGDRKVKAVERTVKTIFENRESRWEKRYLASETTIGRFVDINKRLELELAQSREAAEALRRALADTAKDSVLLMRKFEADRAAMQNDRIYARAQGKKPEDGRRNSF